MFVPFDTTDDGPPAIVDPTFWQDVLLFLGRAGINLLEIFSVIVVAVLTAWVARIVIKRVVKRIVEGAKYKANVDDTQALERSPLASVRLVQRTRTLGSILQNIVNILIVLVSIMLIVRILAPDALGSLTLLTAALGAGLGFGAQNIVRDVLNGMFIVAEDQVGIGDVVDLGLATGVVEYVSVRITHVRDANGTLWYVRNGEILRVGNMSQGWSRAIIDLHTPADGNLLEVERLVLDTAELLAAEPKWRSRMVEHPELWGLESIDGDTLVIRVVQKTRANARDEVGRELRTRLKATMDANNIKIPGLNSVYLTGTDAAERVRGVNPPKTKPQAVVIEDTAPVWRSKALTEAEARKADEEFDTE